jgi:hypothetical protein
MVFTLARHIEVRSQHIEHIDMISRKTKKHSVPIAILLVLALSAIFQQISFAQTVNATPESTVRAFYAWFIRHDTDHSYPLNEGDIYKYVAKDTVNRLRSDYAHGGPPDGVDYFLKVQDYDEGDWLAHTLVRPSILLGDVAVVSVTFGSTDKVNILVFLRKQDGDWKVTKIDDTRDYL